MCSVVRKSSLRPDLSLQTYIENPIYCLYRGFRRSATQGNRNLSELNSQNPTSTRKVHSTLLFCFVLYTNMLTIQYVVIVTKLMHGTCSLATTMKKKRHFATFRSGSLDKHGDGRRTRHLTLGQFVKNRQVFLEFNSYLSLKQEREVCVFTPSIHVYDVAAQ